MNIQGFLFLDDTDTSGESKALNCSDASYLTISVEADATTTVDADVKCRLDMESQQFYACAVTDLSDGTMASSIDDAGLFRLDVRGINQVMIKNNGTAGSIKVFGMLSD